MDYLLRLHFRREKYLQIIPLNFTSFYGTVKKDGFLFGLHFHLRSNSFFIEKNINQITKLSEIQVKSLPKALKLALYEVSKTGKPMETPRF